VLWDLFLCFRISYFGFIKYQMAGYSGTPLVQKLGIKPGHHVALVGSPTGFIDTLGKLPDSVIVLGPRSRAACDVVVFFAANSSTLTKGFGRLAARLKPAGGFWVGWPKKASGVETDLTEDRVREVGLAAGLVDNKVCAIDETWSGLRFVIRIRDRR
jgi:hypothetical protein